MLKQPTIDKLYELRLFGMAKALEEQDASPKYERLDFLDRLALLVDRESAERDTNRLRLRLKQAKLRLTATVEDVDFRHPRGLDKSLVLALAGCRWIREHHNVIITGPTGVGKSYLACALAHKACREGFRALYLRAPRLFDDLALAKADGRYRRVLAAYARIDLLVIDDWGLASLTEEQRRDVLEILEDRHDLRSTLVASQLPIEKWHKVIGDPTLGDAILDRLVHNAHKLTLKGDSLRKKGKKMQS
ncbi:MAG: ATP-binding protein [Candidatus Hydrogenedentes bacterium]|jgi:DNA replication protein DnaC|nr:IS21-like element helper ATPase IstB [Bacillota bacterium]MDY0034056.1 IS21-like element helper ATPase IstB [FCB group bacterium]NLT60210.1 ATP-binding protein [Candidatus Hydrogenedentota bacterium]